jgi:hypothetical protein
MAKSPMPPKFKIDHEAQFFIDFPHLRGSDFKITSPATPERFFLKVHNCFAYTIGKRQWWWPIDYGFWPEGCRFGETLTSFILAYETFGFELCADGSFEMGREKVAIYMAGALVKHVAIQLSSRAGIWRSKCGFNVDIEHSLTALEGGLYGAATAFLSR